MSIVADFTQGASQARPGQRPHDRGARLQDARREKALSHKLDSFMGYRRENGRVGVRNHVLLLPLDDLSNAACEAVANNIKGTLAIPARLWPAAIRRRSRRAFPHAHRHRLQPQCRGCHRHRHRGGLDEAGRRRHRRDRQAGRRLRHRDAWRHLDDRAGQLSWRRNMCSGRANSRARNARFPIFGCRPNAARATRRRASSSCPTVGNMYDKLIPRGIHGVLRRNFRDHRRRASAPGACRDQGSRQALVQDVEGLSGRGDRGAQDRRSLG